MNHIRRYFFLLVLTIGIVRLGDRLEERRRGREGETIFVHILHRSKADEDKLEKNAEQSGSAKFRFDMAISKC